MPAFRRTRNNIAFSFQRVTSTLVQPHPPHHCAQPFRRHPYVPADTAGLYADVDDTNNLYFPVVVYRCNIPLLTPEAAQDLPPVGFPTGSNQAPPAAHGAASDTRCCFLRTQSTFSYNNFRACTHPAQTVIHPRRSLPTTLRPSA